MPGAEGLSPRHGRREFMSCAFSANGWGKYRSGGNGGCSGPTTMAFCEAEFAGDPDRIRCCSNSRCPWSASLFGDNGGNAACLTDDWAVNICCQPCTCWLSPQVRQTPSRPSSLPILR